MTDPHFDMVEIVYILSKQQQSKDSTLQNGTLGQSEKNLDIHVFVWVINPFSTNVLLM